MGLYLLCSIDLCVCVCWCQYHTVLITIALCYSLKSGLMMPPSLSYSGYLSFVFPYKFLNYLFYFYENATGIFFFYSFFNHYFLFSLLNEFYYIYRCTAIITTKFYSISIPNPQYVSPTPNLSHLETVSFSKSMSQYLFCKEVHCVLFLDSTCK